MTVTLTPAMRFSRIKLTHWVAWLFLLVCSSCLLSAHTLPISYLRAVPDSEYLHVELVVNPFEFSFFSELDQNKDRQLDTAELAIHESVVTKRILDVLTVNVGGSVIPSDVAGVTSDLEGHHLTLRAHYKVDARQATLRIESKLAEITSGSHVTQVTLTRNQQQQTAQLDAHSRSVAFVPNEPAGGTPTPGIRGNSISTSILLILALVPIVALGICSLRERIMVLLRKTRHS